MPNWCENDLTVSGDAARVRDFLEFAKSEDRVFDFNRFIPYPAEFEELDRVAAEWRSTRPTNEWRDAPKDGFNSGGYEWCIAHWGTKWNAYRAVYGKEVFASPTMSAVFHFDTAWSPPLPVVVSASERFPSLTFDLRYFERGMCFQGCYRCRAGEVMVSYEDDYFGPRGG